MIPLLSEHDTWISLDPIVGCPARCSYCFVERYGKTGTRPTVRASPEASVELLARHLASDPAPAARGQHAVRAVCLGNYTDMWMTAGNRSFSLEYARLHHQRFPALPLVFVTKAKVSSEFVAELDAVGHAVLVFISQSFFAWCGGEVERGTASPEASLEAMALLAASKHVVPLHFWRPLTRLNVPDATAARRQLGLVRGAGARASVAVGLKCGAYLSARLARNDHPLHSIETRASGATAPVGEDFPDELRQTVLDAAKAEAHPVYLNTSCALSFALGVPDFLSTYRPAMAKTRCLPANCPDGQRERCRAIHEQRLSPEWLDSLAEGLAVPRAAVSERDGVLRVDGCLSQSLQARISHLAGSPCRGAALTSEREWTGAISQDGRERGFKNVVVELDTRGTLGRSIERLRRVTGMLSPVGEGSDARRSVFARYFHVRRVTAVALALSERLMQGGTPLDRERTLRLSWMHDLNRWPFAHHAENGWFAQGADIPRFVRRRRIDANPSEMKDLVGITEHSTADLSVEGSAVLIADRAAGIVEDILLAVTALGFSPDFVPPSVASDLGLPLLEPEFRRRLWRLRESFVDRAIETYVEELDRIATAHSAVFALRFLTSGPGIFDSSFDGTIRRLKTSFLVERLFPIVNEAIGHGSFVQRRVIAPILRWNESIGRKLFSVLDDEQVMDFAIRRGFLSRDERTSCHADLDYVGRELPEWRFVRSSSP